jgi:hypothetical protein
MTRKTRRKVKATNTGGFSITELPCHSVNISVLGHVYMVRLTLINISSRTKKDFTYLYEGTVIVRNKSFTASDFTIKRMIRVLKLDIETFFKKKKKR